MSRNEELVGVCRTTSGCDRGVRCCLGVDISSSNSEIRLARRFTRTHYMDLHNLRELSSRQGHSQHHHLIVCGILLPQSQSSFAEGALSVQRAVADAKSAGESRCANMSAMRDASICGWHQCKLR